MTDVEAAPLLALPPRPARPLSLLQLIRAARVNWLAACDDALFEESLVERRVLWRRCFIINDPDGIRRVLQDNYDNYPRFYPLRRVFQFESASGMLCAEGDEWRRHRRLINPTLDHRALLADLPVLDGLAEAMAEYLSRLPPGQEIDVARTLVVWTIAAAGHVFAGNDREIDGLIDRMGSYPKKANLMHFVPLPRWLPSLGRYSSGPAEARRLRPMLDRLIADRRRPDYAGREDLLWRMIKARDPRDGNGLTAVELRDEMMTLGATARTMVRPLTWLLYLLARHPRAEATLHEELDGVLGGRSPMSNDLPRLSYLRRLIDETMRLYPSVPVFIPRVATEADVICGRRIPRNSIVMIIPWVLHRHRRLWHDPDRFDPERFGPEQTAARSRYSYLPFSIGPHVCVGASLQMLQVTVAIAVLAQRFRFRLVQGRPVEPKGWIHLSSTRPIMMTLELRSRMRR